MSAFEQEQAPMPPEAMGAPQEPPEAPQAMRPPSPEQQNVPGNDAVEVEARDQLGLEITLAAEEMASASRAARGRDDHQGAENYAQATHKLVQALVLLTPITAADDLVAGTGGGVPAGLSTQRERTDQ